LAWKTGIDDILIVTVLLISVSGILNLLVQRLNQVIGRAESNEKAQFEANRELRALQSSLEKRVEERTFELTERGQELEHLNQQAQRRAAQFQAVTQVTQDITSIRDLRDLLPRIATVISEKFGFYHVGVFLLDEVNEYAILSATNSEGGKKMLERKHRLRVGEQGIVGNVTKTGIPRIAMDVGTDAVFFDNPELPDTHSEMALPLKSGDLIVGALDVQSKEHAAFTQEDVQMLSLLAHQVSLAIENARLFEETRKALSESEAISRQTTREAWRSLPTERGLIGYRYTLVGTSPLEQPVDVTEPKSSKSSGIQTEIGRIVVPIELRGETIGALVVQSPSTAQVSQEQLDLIKAVAERVAISAENARLFDETTRRAERERMVSEITSKIRSVNDPQVMIQTAMEELRNALGASRVEVIPQTVRGADK
jgi:GAF domain-containing protein